VKTSTTPAERAERDGSHPSPPSSAFEDTPGTGDSGPAAGSQAPPPAPEGASTAGAPHPEPQEPSGDPDTAAPRDPSTRRHMAEHPPAGAGRR